MQLNMYEAAVPTCSRALANLATILEKAEKYAEARKIDPVVLLNARLFPDMLPLSMQIVIAGDIARGGTARLAGAEVPAPSAATSSFAELIAGLRKSIAFMETLKPEQFIGAEDRTVTWSTRSSNPSMQGTPYLFNHVLPNVFFHVTTAYDILRHSGLEIGKKDYLGTA